MKNLKEFKELLAVQSVSYNQGRMSDYLKSQLNLIAGVSFYEINENIFVEKGEGLKPCIVSHIDTVHSIVSDLYSLEIDGNLTGFNRKTMTQSGIGGDDKCGIWICLEALKNFDNVKVAFFSNEEVGCIGSYSTNLDFFNDCSFVLQCDRQGNNDFVINACGVELSSKEFQNSISKTIKKYGYGFSDGGMTDIMALKENGLDICCANMSCGYYNPHRPNEYINIKDVETCTKMVFHIFANFGGVKFLHKVSKSWGEFEEMRCENCNSEVSYYKDMDDYFCNNCAMYGEEIKY